MSEIEYRVKCPCCGAWHTNKNTHKKLVNWCAYCVDKTVELQRDMKKVCPDCGQVYANCVCEVGK